MLLVGRYNEIARKRHWVTLNDSPGSPVVPVEPERHGPSRGVGHRANPRVVLQEDRPVGKPEQHWAAAVAAMQADRWALIVPSCWVDDLENGVATVVRRCDGQPGVIRHHPGRLPGRQPALTNIERLDLLPNRKLDHVVGEGDSRRLHWNPRGRRAQLE